MRQRFPAAAAFLNVSAAPYKLDRAGKSAGHEYGHSKRIGGLSQNPGTRVFLHPKFKVERLVTPQVAAVGRNAIGQSVVSRLESLVCDVPPSRIGERGPGDFSGAAPACKVEAQRFVCYLRFGNDAFADKPVNKWRMLICSPPSSSKIQFIQARTFAMSSLVKPRALY